MMLDWSWIIVLPAAVWGIVDLYVPILGAPLSALQAWVVALLSLLLCFLSLAVHAWAHRLAWRPAVDAPPVDAGQAGSAATQAARPAIFLYVFGDASQGWPASARARREAEAALLGPCFNLLLAWLAYLAYNALLNSLLNLSLLFACAFNVWLAAINLIPAYPFDGGRLLRALAWGLLDGPRRGGQAARLLGILVALGLAGWGIYLLAENDRFSPQTGWVTIAFGILLLWSAFRQRPWPWRPPSGGRLRIPFRPLRLGFILLACLLLSVAPAALLLLNDGLEAPGPALSVEPMVVIPDQYRHTHPGTFILTSVWVQTPILAGEWLAGKLDRSYHIVSAEDIVPRNVTPQETARQARQDLDQSALIAVVVALRQAGYPVETVDTGVEVVDVLPDSPALNLLQPDDIITAVDGTTTPSDTSLVAIIARHNPGDTVSLQVKRDQSQLTVSVRLMPPAQPGGAPRIGISIQSAVFNAQLPFPVQINPQKIVGGPSAGLMFTLTVYNGLIAQDLTGGRRIAGTGTIGLDGTVGPIGGVQQKVVAAERAGAAYFFSPEDNYADAISVARHIQVVRVATFQEALDFLKSLPQTPATR